MVRTGWLRRGVWAPTLCILGACGLGEPAAPKGSPSMTPERFIEVYTALRRAAAATDDTLAFDSMRNEILRAHGVTEEDLFEFALMHGRDIEAMLELWDSIQSRLSVPDTGIVAQ